MMAVLKNPGYAVLLVSPMLLFWPACISTAAFLHLPGSFKHGLPLPGPWWTGADDIWAADLYNWLDGIWIQPSWRIAWIWYCVFPNGSIYFSVSCKDFLRIPLCKRSCSKYIGLKTYGLNWLKISIRGDLKTLAGMASDSPEARSSAGPVSCLIAPCSYLKYPVIFPDGTRWCCLGK